METMFRGKSIKTGVLVSGYHVHYDDVLEAGKDDCDYIVMPHNGNNFPFVQVETASVGRKFDLPDVKGNPIFEGDILRMNGTADDLYVVNYGKFAVIDMETEQAVDWVFGWFITPHDSNPFRTISPFCLPVQINEDNLKISNAEVVGNLHKPL